MILYAHNLLPAFSAGPSLSAESIEGVQFAKVVENHQRYKQMFASQPLITAPVLEHFAHYASAQDFTPSLGREFCFSIAQQTAGAPLFALILYAPATQEQMTLHISALPRIVAAYELFINCLLAQPVDAPLLLGDLFADLLEHSTDGGRKLKADLETLLGALITRFGVNKSIDTACGVLRQCLYLAPRSSTSVPLSGRSSSSSSRTSAAPTTYPHAASALSAVSECFEKELDADGDDDEKNPLSRHQLRLDLGFEGDISPALFMGGTGDGSGAKGGAGGGSNADAGFRSPFLVEGKAGVPAAKRPRGGTGADR